MDDFIVSGPTTSALVSDKEGVRKDLKGKGKAVDNGQERAASCDMDIDPDNRMNDITNNSAFFLRGLMCMDPNKANNSV